MDFDKRLRRSLTLLRFTAVRYRKGLPVAPLFITTHGICSNLGRAFAASGAYKYDEETALHRLARIINAAWLRTQSQRVQALGSPGIPIYPYGMLRGDKWLDEEEQAELRMKLLDFYCEYIHGHTGVWSVDSINRMYTLYKEGQEDE